MSYDNHLEGEAVKIKNKKPRTGGERGRKGEMKVGQERGGGSVAIYLLASPALIFHNDWRPSVDDEGGSCESVEALQVHSKVNTVQSL